MPSQQQGAGHLVLTANGNDAAEHGGHRRPVSRGGTRSEPGKLIWKLFLAKHRVQFIRGCHRRSLRIALGTATYAPILGSVRQDVWPLCGQTGKNLAWISEPPRWNGVRISTGPNAPLDWHLPGAAESAAPFIFGDPIAAPSKTKRRLSFPRRRLSAGTAVPITASARSWRRSFRWSSCWRCCRRPHRMPGQPEVQPSSYEA
jgi:hypothetical protein